MPKIIYLQKIGLIQKSILKKMEKSLEWAYRALNLSVKILSYELPLLYNEYNEFKKQYNGDLILKRLLKYAKSKKFFRVLGIIDQDIFSNLYDFRFGCAKFSEKSNNGVALISLYRLKESFYGRDEDPVLFEIRILKEGLHELGHTFGLSLNNHCQNYCVMNFSTTVKKIEEKPAEYCESCKIKIASYFNNLEE